MTLDRFLESAAEFGGVLPKARPEPLGRKGTPPVPALAQALVERPGERPAGQELAHVAEEGLLARDEAGREELRQDGLVQGGPQRTRRQDRFDLRREQQLPADLRVIKRLDPQAVPRQEEPAPRPIP